MGFMVGNAAQWEAPTLGLQSVRAGAREGYVKREARESQERGVRGMERNDAALMLSPDPVQWRGDGAGCERRRCRPRCCCQGCHSRRYQRYCLTKIVSILFSHAETTFLSKLVGTCDWGRVFCVCLCMHAANRTHTTSSGRFEPHFRVSGDPFCTLLCPGCFSVRAERDTLFYTFAHLKHRTF